MVDKMPRGRTKEVTDEELFEAGRETVGPAFTAGEIAKQIDEKIEREACRQRLNALVEKGLLAKKLRGGTNLYWIQSPVESPDSSPEPA